MSAMTYWKEGTQIIEECLIKSQLGKMEDAPFPLDAAKALIWHRAQAEAYAHALEMMGYSEDSPHVATD